MLAAYIKEFESLSEYQNWVNSQFASLRSINRGHLDEYSKDKINSMARSQPSWFGKGVTYDELAAGITQYKEPALIEKILGQVTDKINAETTDRIQSRKIQYNALGLGNFSFDRAAMGMYRLKEYYCPSLQITVDRSLVSPAPDGFILTADRSAVIERWEQRPDGKPKIRTSSRKVFAYYPKVSKEKQAVDIYIGCGGSSGISAEQFLYSGVSAIVVAQLLEKARIPTRICIAIGTSPDEFKGKVYGALIPVKEYDEPLDSNLLALLSSDPRFYRFEGFKGVVSIYDHFGAKCPFNMGTGLNNQSLQKTIEASTYTLTAKLAPNRLYFGRTFSEAEAINAINAAIDKLATNQPSYD